MGNTKQQPQIDSNEITGLSAIIDALRNDLFASSKQRHIEFEPLFSITEATIELNVTIAKSEEKKAGFKAYIFSVAGGNQTSNAITHKLTVKLLPHPEAIKRKTINLDRAHQDPLARGSGVAKKSKPKPRVS